MGSYAPLPPLQDGPAPDPATLAPLPPLAPGDPGKLPMTAPMGGTQALPAAPLGSPAPLPPLAPATPAAAPSAAVGSAPLPTVLTVPAGGGPAAEPVDGMMPPGEITAPNPEEIKRKAAAESDAIDHLSRLQDHAYRAESAAVTQQADLAARRGAEEARLRQQQQQQQDALDAAHAEKMKYFAGERDKATAAVGKAIDEANATPFDENHYMHSLGAGGTALTLLSLAFGGFATGFTHGPNVGLQMLDAAIDRDIDAQKFAYQKKRQTVADKQTAYAQLREAGMDEEQAYHGATLVTAAKLNTALNVLSAQYAGPAAQANAQLVRAGLQKTAVGAQTQFLQLTMNAAAQNWNERMQLAQVAAMGTAARTRSPTPAESHAQEMAQLTIDGLQGHAKTPEAYTKATEVESSYRTIIPEVQQLKAFREKNGREKLNRTDLAKAKALAHDVQLQAKNLYQLGVLSQSDLDMLSTLVPEDVNSFFSFDDAVIGGLDQFANSMTLARNNKLGVYGFREPSPGSVLGPVAGERPARP